MHFLFQKWLYSLQRPLLYNLPLIGVGVGGVGVGGVGVGVVVLLVPFQFFSRTLGIIHCNFADMFSILLLNDSQSLNTFEILVWDIFAFFCAKFLCNLWI